MITEKPAIKTEVDSNNELIGSHLGLSGVARSNKVELTVRVECREGCPIQSLGVGSGDTI